MLLGFIILPADTVNAEDIYTNPSTGYRAVIDDKAEIISEDDEFFDQMTEKMQEITNYGNVSLATVSSGSFESTRDYARSILREEFGKDSSTVFLVDMVHRQIFVFSDGKILKTISQARGYIITDNIYKYATGAQYTECAFRAFEQEVKLLEGGRIAQPMKYISCLLFALLFAGIIVYEYARTCASVTAVTTDELLKHTKYDLGLKDIQIRNLKTRRVDHSDRSSGGGFSGSSSGGGFSSGGGGGGHGF